MSARIPYRLSHHIRPYRDRSPHIRALFSTSARSPQQHDPATALADTIKPSNSRRPPQIPVPSRSGSDLGDGAENPFLGKYPVGSATNPERARVRSADPKGAQNLIESVMRGAPRSRPTRPAREPKGAAIRKIEMQATRPWQEGDVYSPHDLSPTEMMKNLKARNTRIKIDNYSGNTASMKMKDDLDRLNINPLNEYKNFAMMSEFVTEMGKIKSRRETGFRGPNQRKMAKAVRRAIGIGILPSVHKHPELYAERRDQMKKAGSSR